MSNGNPYCLLCCCGGGWMTCVFLYCACCFFLVVCWSVRSITRSRVFCWCACWFFLASVRSLMHSMFVYFCARAALLGRPLVCSCLCLVFVSVMFLVMSALCIVGRVFVQKHESLRFRCTSRPTSGPAVIIVLVPILESNLHG